MSISHREFLCSLGWDEFFEDQIGSTDLIPCRVVGQERDLYSIQFAPGQIVSASVSGKFRFEVQRLSEFPAVGDWVLCDFHPGSRAVIHQVLNRKTCIQRKSAGEEREVQTIAVNVDHLFIATSLNEDFNLQRLDRYMTLARDSGAAPVLLLTKTDLASDLESLRRDLEAHFPDVELVALTMKDPKSIDGLRPFLGSGKTAAIVGSSGVGKSTLVNHLLGTQAISTQEIRADDGKGRHTTTSRHLFLIPWGGAIVDTPGMREIQMADHDNGLDRNFEDVTKLSARCRFGNCGHGSEPGCAVQMALGDGSLTEGRWQSYLKLLREIRHFQRKTDRALASTDRKKWKQISANNNQRAKWRGR